MVPGFNGESRSGRNLMRSTVHKVASCRQYTHTRIGTASAEKNQKQKKTNEIEN